MPHARSIVRGLPILTCVLLSACEDDGIRAYRVPKESHSHREPQAPARVAWSVPEGWSEVQSDQPMRIATFRAGAQGSVELTVSAFPGDAGGLLANVNRWRGQLGLEPTTEAALAAELVPLTIPGGDAATLRIKGGNGQDMLGAIIHPGDGQTWFVKATSSPEALTALDASFRAFSSSFRIDGVASGGSNTGASSGMGSAADAGILPHVPSGSDVAQRLAAWTPPAGWVREAGASGIVAAAYTTTSTQGAARITATSLMNDGGGALANINRWRDQLGLAPVPNLEQQPLTDLGNEAFLVDLADPAGARRMIAAVVRAGPDTWFFKLTGAPGSVEAEKAGFTTFVRSVGLGEQ